MKSIRVGAIILTPIILFFVLLFMYYFVFFWGAFLMGLLGIIVIIGGGITLLIGAIKEIKIKKLLKHQVQLEVIKKRRNINAHKTNLIKLIKCITASVLSISLMIFFVTTFFYKMFLDLPNVINKNFVVVDCVVEERHTGFRSNRHQQQLTVRDIKNNEMIKIEFDHNYKRILENRVYVIKYLPHSHLGYSAKLIR